MCDPISGFSFRKQFSGSSARVKNQLHCGRAPLVVFLWPKSDGIVLVITLLLDLFRCPIADQTTRFPQRRHDTKSCTVFQFEDRLENYSIKVNTDCQQLSANLN